MTGFLSREVPDVLVFPTFCHILVFQEVRVPGILVCGLKVKRKERLELEEEREDLLDLFVVLRRPAEKRACIELIEEVDACLDDVYSAHEAAKSFPRMLYNCVTQYAFKPDQIVSIRNAWQSRMALD